MSETLLVADALEVLAALFASQWGIYGQDGSPLMVADNVVGMDYRREFRVADFPIEEGGFASYNKVALPYDARVTFSVADGGPSARGAFLAQVAAACESLDLCSVVTPEFTYPSANVIHYDYRRHARHGARLLEVEVWLQEIRVVTVGQFTAAQEDKAADAKDGGTVQTAEPTSTQIAAAARTPYAGSGLRDKDIAASSSTAGQG